MDKGRILFLNGVTGAGKTAVIQALEDRDDVSFHVVANELSQAMAGERWLPQTPWQALAEVIGLMYHTAKRFSDEGHNVLVDSILVEKPEFDGHLRRLLAILRDNPLAIIEVACPLAVCRARNIARGDRYPALAEEQAALMAADIPYAMRVETHLHTPEACAEQIVQALLRKETP